MPGTDKDATMGIDQQIYETSLKTSVDAEGPYEAARAAIDGFAEGKAFDILVTRIFNGDARTVRVGDGPGLPAGAFEVSLSFGYESDPAEVADCFEDAARQFQGNVAANRGWYVAVTHVASGTEWTVDTDEGPEAYADWRDDLPQAPTR